MLYPTPSHLRDVLVPIPPLSDANELNGKLKCSCGSGAFRNLYVATRIAEGGPHFLRVIEVGGHHFLRLGAQCTECAKEYLLLDHDFHGWNGYVCGNEADRAVKRPPFELWTCQKCDGTNHKIELEIVGDKSKQDTIEESDGALSETDWFDAFGWFTLSITCTRCGFGPVAIVDYETR